MRVLIYEANELIYMLTSIEYLRKFNEMQQSTVDITRLAAKQIKPGMSELDIADIYAKKLKEAGLKNHWYPILVYVGEWTGKPISRRYHLPSPDVIIQESDIVILDSTPLNKTVWSNWAETFLIGQNPFFASLIADTKQVVEETYNFAVSKAKTIGDIFDYCFSRITYYDLRSLDSRNDVGHSIFQVPEGQTVDQTPLSDRLFINQDYKDSPAVGIISIEPQLGRVDPENGKLFGAKMQKVIIR